MDGPTLKRNLKIVVVAAAVVVVAILVFQNTEPTRTKILFATITMPRAVLLVVMLAIGFALGVLTAARLRAKPGSTGA